jgi:hypothetical protein
MNKRGKLSNLKGNIYEFKNKTKAFYWACRCVTTHLVFYVDNDTYWVVNLSDTSILIDLGYETVEDC